MCTSAHYDRPLRMSSQSSPAFLSVRVPEATRDRLKAAAAARGETVQGLVGGLVERFLVEVDRKPPVLAAIIGKLRSHAPALRHRGIRELWLFGSVARGDARPDSDVDLFAEFEAEAALSLVSLASLRSELTELLGVAADLVEQSAMRPAVRVAAEREAIRVL